MLKTIITQHNAIVKLPQTAGGSTSAPGAQPAFVSGNNVIVPTVETSASPVAASDTAASPLLLAPEPPAALFEDTPEIRYLAALALVRRIDADLTMWRGAACNPSRHYRRGGRLLNTLDEVVRAILDGELEVG